MSYEYATENLNYEDFSSGRVLYNQQGATSFPVRLTCEIFLRCATILEKDGNTGPYSIYDPLCGGAYSLTTLGFLYSNKISRIYASDIDDMVIGLAKKNLSLLTEKGLMERTKQLEQMLQDYGKESHRGALLSANKFYELIKNMPHQIDVNCFVSDALKPDHYTDMEKVDIVITDLPYGEVVDWINAKEEEVATIQFLHNLLPILKKQSIVAVTSRKKTIVRHESFQRVDHFNLGKRQIVFLKPK
jgi:23S rRNA (guanine2535-N1)-methyltransferase